MLPVDTLRQTFAAFLNRVYNTTEI